MKFKALALLCLISFQSFAQVDQSQEPEVVVNEDSTFEVPSVRIREIRELIREKGEENTCMDEYLKRRNRLIIKLALAPAVIPAGFYVATVGTGFAGLLLGYSIGVEPLATAIGGMALGAVGGGTGLLTDTGLGIKHLIETDRILKSLGELHLNRAGTKTQRLYSKYAQNNENAVDEKSFEIALLNLDQEGKLCDGTLTKNRVLTKGHSLRKRLARTKHLRMAIQ